jgi:hypothetical protein
MTVSMPRRVAEIRHAIVTNLDFTVLAHGGEAEVFEWARQNGRRGGSVVIEWEHEYRRQQQALSPVARPAPAPQPKVEDDEPDDLGPEPPEEWPVDDDNDDGAPPPQSPTILCPTCRGTGRDKSGAKCSACNGTGRVPSVIDDDDDDDDDGNEKESRWYEYEIED